MNKRILVILCLVLCLCMSVAFVACDGIGGGSNNNNGGGNNGGTKPHVHVFDGDYEYDDVNHWQTCECGQKKTSVHEFTDWTIVTPATTTSEGTKKSTCFCGYEITGVIPVIVLEDTSLDLYAINDFHGKVERIAQFGMYFKQRKLDNANTLLINSGDMFQGSVASNSNYGKLLTDCMDNIGFDSFTYGNHEFDWGLDKVRELSAYAKTPFLGANIYKWDAKTREFGEFASDIAREYTIKQLPNGLKVGIIGVIGKDQITSISSNLVQDIGFKDPREIIPGLSQKLRYEEGCHVVVVSIHAPQNTLFMASSDFDIDDYADAVFCGHSHADECDITVGGTPFLQGMSYGQMVSHVRLDVTASGEVSCNTYENIRYSSSWDSDQSIQQIVDTYAEDYEQMAAQKLGNVDSYLSYTAEMPRLACRAMAEYAVSQGYDDIVLALTNQARTDLPGGTITYGKLYESLPFDNVVYIAEVTGTNLITLARSNYFWRVSGERVVNDAKHVYKIAIIDYVLLHQNSNRMYDRAASAFESGRMEPIALTKADGSKYNYREMTRDYILKVGTINSDDYNGKNVFTNRDSLTKDVTMTASLSEVAPVQYCLAANFVGKYDYAA